MNSASQCKRRYEPPPPPPRIQKLLDICEQEVLDLTLREVKCPKCNFVIDRGFSDVSGHFLSKCPKCKAQYIMRFNN